MHMHMHMHNRNRNRINNNNNNNNNKAPAHNHHRCEATAKIQTPLPFVTSNGHRPRRIVLRNRPHPTPPQVTQCITPLPPHPAYVVLHTGYARSCCRCA